MGNKFKLSPERIQRLESLERKFGIEDMSIFAYLRQGNELIVNGEIYGDKLTDSIEIICSVYDKDGDIIASSPNNDYSRGFVSHCIRPRSFKGIFPFSINVKIPEGQTIDRIRVYVSKC